MGLILLVTRALSTAMLSSSFDLEDLLVKTSGCGYIIDTASPEYLNSSQEPKNTYVSNFYFFKVIFRHKIQSLGRVSRKKAMVLPLFIFIDMR